MDISRRVFAPLCILNRRLRVDLSLVLFVRRRRRRRRRRVLFSATFVRAQNK